MSKSNDAKSGTLRSILGKVHRDEEGGVSIETVLIIAAIALPILIFLYKVAWPAIRQYWEVQQKDLFQDPAGGGVP